MSAVGKVAGIIGGGPDDATPRSDCGKGSWGESATTAPKGSDAEKMEDDQGRDGAKGCDTKCPDVAIFDAGGGAGADG